MENLAAGTLILILVSYFLPTIIAFMRGHQSKLAILLVNVCLGWTMLFWFICLVWSLCSSKQTVINIHNSNNMGN